jgi:hypothetical protein
MSKNIYDKLKINICKVLGDDEGGTGFLISEKFILTAFHVVNGCDEIKVTFDNKKEHNVTLHKLIDEDYKKLDIAILELCNSVDFYEDIEIVDLELTPKKHWISRGYPQAQDVTGTNLVKDGNIINQQLKNLHENRIDIQLDIGETFSSYSGLSGAPLIVEEKIVGVLNSELSENKIAKQLNAISVKHFKELLEQINIQVIKGKFQNKSCDDISANEWEKLSTQDDARNLNDKLQEVCSGIFERKIKLYNKSLTLGKIEQEIYDERDISAVKYVVFEKCQHRLIDFYDTNKDKNELSLDEIKLFLQNYISDAKLIIEDKRKVYNYPTFTDDFVEKIILDLIDECFLSFDEKGIYDD